MSDDQLFKDGDIVWVKLGNNWWPGEVIGHAERIPEEVGRLKKKPYCVVKFFQEDAYEYAKSPKQVFPFQCPKKDEFIKKGLALHKAKNAFMEKFPEDVKYAESLTKPQVSTITTKIINNCSSGLVKTMWGQDAIRMSIEYNESINSSTSNGNGGEKNSRNQSILRRDSVTTILNITPNRASLGSATATPISTPPRASATTSRTLSTSSSASVTPNSATIGSSSCPYRCNMCDFTTTRQNVLIMHRKSHSSSGNGGGSAVAALPMKSLGINKSQTTTTTQQPSSSLIVTSSSDGNISANNKTTKGKIATTETRHSPVTPLTTKRAEKSHKSATNKTTQKLETSPIEQTYDSPTAMLSTEKRSRRKVNASPATTTRTVKTSPNDTNKRSTRTSRSTPQLAVISPALEDVSSSDVSSTKTLITVVPADSEKSSIDDTDANSPVDEEHSEQIRQRLLADWSDEDKDEDHTNSGIKGTSKGKQQLQSTSSPSFTPSSSSSVLLQLPTTNSKSTQRRRSPTIVPLKTLEGAGQTLVMTATVSPPTAIKPTPQRIRNIPKKDRLREFEKSMATNDELHEVTEPQSTSIEPIIVLEKSDNNCGTTTDTTVLEVEVMTVTTTAETTTQIVETSATTVNTPSTAAESFSCFDFQEDEEEQENDVLKSIANFKKKYYSPEKDKTHQTGTNNEQISPSKSNIGLEIEQRDLELSAQIDHLLEQTTNVSTPKDDVANAVSVKGLPIKERGKRIFKSRNRSRVEDEDIMPQISEPANESMTVGLVPNKDEETEKTKQAEEEHKIDSPEETTSTTERKTRSAKNKRQHGKETPSTNLSSSSPSPVNGNADKNVVVINPIVPTSIDPQVLESITESALVPQRSKRKPYNHRIMRQLIEDEEASIPFISHSPVELFNCESTLDNSIGARIPTSGRRSKTATPNSIVASREENLNGGSRASSRSLNAPTEDSSSFGVSETGAEFGSPASSLDEERLMTPRSEIEKSNMVVRGDEMEMDDIQIENEEFGTDDNEDDDEIESPPHEALSGNELEGNEDQQNNRKVKTPKKKLNTKENVKHTEQKSVPLLIGRRKLRAETESPNSDDALKLHSPKRSKRRGVGEVEGQDVIEVATVAQQCVTQHSPSSDDALKLHSPKRSRRRGGGEVEVQDVIEVATVAQQSVTHHFPSSDDALKLHSPKRSKRRGGGEVEDEDVIEVATVAQQSVTQHSANADDALKLHSPKRSKRRGGGEVEEVIEMATVAQQSGESIENSEDRKTPKRNSKRKTVQTEEKDVLVVEETKKPNEIIDDDLNVENEINMSKIIENVTKNIELDEFNENSMETTPQRDSSTTDSYKDEKIEVSTKSPNELEIKLKTNDNENILETIPLSVTEVKDDHLNTETNEDDKKIEIGSEIEMETKLKITESVKDEAQIVEQKAESPVPAIMLNDFNELKNNSLIITKSETANIQEEESKVPINDATLQVDNVFNIKEKEDKQEGDKGESNNLIEENKEEKNGIKSEIEEVTSKDHIKIDKFNNDDAVSNTKEQTIESPLIPKSDIDIALTQAIVSTAKNIELTTPHKPNEIDSKTDLISSTEAVNSNILSPTATEIVEKVRINVDVANPLSSQIANILASSGNNNSSQQHQLSANNKIKSSKLKSSTTSLKRKHSHEEILSTDGHDDVVAHVQSLCPQVKITRKERIIEPSINPKTSDSTYDINQMPIVLGNEQNLAQKETPLNVTNLWQTDLLQSPLTATKSDDEQRQLTPQKKIGFDSRSQKYKTIDANSPQTSTPISSVTTTTTLAEQTKNLSSPQLFNTTGSNSLSSTPVDSSTLLSRTSQSPSPQKSPAGLTGGRKHAGNTITIPSSLTVKQHQHKFAEALALADSIRGASTKPTKRRNSQSIASTSLSASVSGANTNRRLSSTAAISVQSPSPAKITKTLSTEELSKSSPSKSDNSCSPVPKTWSQTHRHTQKQKKLEPSNIGADGDTVVNSPPVEAVIESSTTTTTTASSTSTNSTTKAVPADENQMIVEAEQLNSTAKITAVPIQPIPGYAETFLLCMLVDNMYKPINNIPHYLNTDLNQLVPVPPEAYEGMLPELIVDQPPTPSVDNEIENGATALSSDATSTGATCGASTGSGNKRSGNEILNTSGGIDDESDLKTQLQSGNSTLAIAGESDSADGSGETSTDSAIVLNLNDQQIILDASTFEQLLANPDASTQLVTDDGTEFVLTREVLVALKAQHDEQNVELLAIPAEQQQLIETANSEAGSSADLLSVALANSEFYGNDVLQIETTLGAGAGGDSSGLQLLASDGSIVFQAPPLPQAHLTPPITAHTSETNAVLNQTPIMSTLEKPSTGVVAGKSGIVSSVAAVMSAVESNMPGMRPNLDDSLAVIGVTTQPSTVPSSLELPITITNPAIAPKVTMAPSAHGADLLQFQPHRSVATTSVAAAVAAAAAAGVTHIYDDPME